jgi:hypothetical protein
MHDIKAHQKRMDAYKIQAKQESDIKFYNSEINVETMTLKSNVDKYIDPIVKERKEKDKFKKRILL